MSDAEQRLLNELDAEMNHPGAGNPDPNAQSGPAPQNDYVDPDALKAAQIAAALKLAQAPITAEELAAQAASQQAASQAPAPPPPAAAVEAQSAAASTRLTRFNDISAQEQTMAVADAQLKALDEGFAEGSIEAEEVSRKRHEIMAQRDAANSAIAVENSRRQAETAAFQTAANEHLNRHPEFNLNPRIKALLDNEVRQVTSNPELNHLTFGEMLNLAHNRIYRDADMMGVAGSIPQLRGGAPAPVAHNPGVAPQPQPIPGMPNIPATVGGVPVTLAQVPQSNVVSVNGASGRYAQLENLEGQDYERALMGMTEDQRENYLRSMG